MKLETLLGEFCANMNLTPPQLDENNACALVFNERVHVTIEGSPDHKTAHISAQLCPLPEEHRAELLLRLMEDHLFGIATENNYFGFDPVEEKLLLFKNFQLDKTDGVDFLMGLESFVSVFEYWEARLKEDSPEFTGALSETVTASGEETLAMIRP